MRLVKGLTQIKSYSNFTKKDWADRNRRRKLKKQRRIEKEIDNKNIASSRASTLEGKITKAEKILKDHLENINVPFQFQKPFASHSKIFILDFYFETEKAGKIAVELDGGYHLPKDQQIYDAERTIWLIKKQGISVLRFKNEDVINNPNEVVDRILSYVPLKIQELKSTNKQKREARFL